jgi:hypothetical protein
MLWTRYGHDKILTPTHSRTRGEIKWEYASPEQLQILINKSPKKKGY